AALLDAAEVWLGMPSRLAATDVLDWWLRVDLERDSWLLERDGTPVAVGWLERHGEVFNAAGIVHPNAKGEGLGQLLADISEAHASEHGARVLRQFTPARDSAARVLFEG